jgi:basic membrane protein A
VSPSKEASASNGEAESAREERLQQLIDAGYTNIVAVGLRLRHRRSAKVAKANPNVKFARRRRLVADSEGDNIENITFAEHEGSFLVGAAAAMKSKTGNIGFVGGVEIDLIKKFEAGFTAGCQGRQPQRHGRREVPHPAAGLLGFGSVDKGKTAAEGMYQNGADVVYHAAGGSGGGVFTAAKAAGKMAIGVDSDQAADRRSRVSATSSSPRCSRRSTWVIFDFIKSVKDGKPSRPASVTLDLKSGGVDYATTGGKVDDIKTKLDNYKQQIIDGKITVSAKLIPAGNLPGGPADATRVGRAPVVPGRYPDSPAEDVADVPPSPTDPASITRSSPSAPQPPSSPRRLTHPGRRPYASRGSPRGSPASSPTTTSPSRWPEARSTPSSARTARASPP